MRNILIIAFLIVFTFFKLNAQNQYNSIQVDVNYDFVIDDFSYCSFYEFQIEENTDLENEALIFLKDSLTNAGYFSEENRSVQIYSIIGITWSDVQYNFIYYSTIIDENKEYNFAGFQNISDAKLENLRNVLRLQNDVFWYFYNNEEDEEFQPLNQIRLSVNDANGNLNLFKLAEAITSNQDVFNPYFVE